MRGAAGSGNEAVDKIEHPSAKAMLNILCGVPFSVLLKSLNEFAAKVVFETAENAAPEVRNVIFLEKAALCRTSYVL